MMKKSFYFFLFISWSVSAQDFSAYQKRELKMGESKILPYRILLPENYDRSKKYPLVIVLHGVHERGSDNEKQLKHGASLFLSSEARSSFPCIVIFPQCAEDGYWSSVKIDVSKKPIDFDFDYSRPATAQLNGVTMLINRIIKEESVDKKRVYISGLSMGGFGAFEIAYRSPKLFAAVIPICGGGDVSRYSERMKKTPLWVFHGTDDDVVNVKYSREMVEKLRLTTKDVKYSEYPGVKHNSWDNAFAEPEFLKWMFSKKRK